MPALGQARQKSREKVRSMRRSSGRALVLARMSRRRAYIAWACSAVRLPPPVSLPVGVLHETEHETRENKT